MKTVVHSVKLAWIII